MSEQFKREDRYIVVKRADLEKIKSSAASAFLDAEADLQSHLPKREFLVIESDWPEYWTAWRAIEARMTGVTPVVTVGNHERARFEQAALQRAVKRRQEGNVIDDNGCEITPETLFWKDANGNYGVHMFNAAWWGWKSACEAALEVDSTEDRVGDLQKEVARLNEEEHLSQLHLERAVRASENLRDKLVYLSSLLKEVSSCYTRNDDLPNNLLPRIDAALAPVNIASDATKS